MAHRDRLGREQHPAPITARRPLLAWALGGLLFVLILCGYLLSFTVDQPAHNGDWFLRYQVTCRIVEHNRFTIVPYQTDARSGPGLGGATYTQYTLGQTVAMIPLYLLGRALAGLAHTDCTDPAPAQVLLTCKLLGPLLGALLCVLFFALARLLGYARPLALGLTLLLAFGTSLWPDAQSNLEHTLESLLLLVAAYAAVRYTLQRRKEALWVSVMGLAAGLEFVTRVSGIIVPPIFLLYLLVLHRRWRPGSWWPAFRDDAVTFALCLLPSLGVNAAFNLLRFGSPLRIGPYPDASLGFPMIQGLPDLLLSPGKGLLWYSPAVLLLVLAARPFARRCPLPARLFALIGGVYLLFYANVNYWHGDPAWGPRYLYATLPYLILPLGEVWRRWRAYSRPVRGMVVGVLACSFLVQFAAVSVSYWRWEHGMFAYHVDQAEQHGWGWNLNYYWRLDQSPLVSALGGVGEITRQYIVGAPTVRHWYADARYGSGNEGCVFRVRGQAAVCLTDADDLRLRENWNTFTFWWLHDYPWWGRETTTALAVLLLAAFLGTGALLIIRVTPRPTSALSPPPVRSRSVGTTVGTTVGTAMALPRSLGAAVSLAALVYGGIMVTAAARAPAHVPPLVYKVSMGRTVIVGNLAYSVLGATEFVASPVPLAAGSPRGYRDLIVLLRLRNLSARPWSWKLRDFALTDAAGRAYPMAGDLNAPAAALYHVPLLWAIIPPRGAVEVVEAFEVPAIARRLSLLGPGIAMISLRVAAVRSRALEIAPRRPIDRQHVTSSAAFAWTWITRARAPRPTRHVGVARSATRRSSRKRRGHYGSARGRGQHQGSRRGTAGRHRRT